MKENGAKYSVQLGKKDVSPSWWLFVTNTFIGLSVLRMCI